MSAYALLARITSNWGPNPTGSRVEACHMSYLKASWCWNSVFHYCALCSGLRLPLAAGLPLVPCPAIETINQPAIFPAAVSTPLSSAGDAARKRLIDLRPLPSPSSFQPDKLNCLLPEQSDSSSSFVAMAKNSMPDWFAEWSVVKFDPFVENINRKLDDLSSRVALLEAATNDNHRPG